jgi:hypothetical protein
MHAANMLLFYTGPTVWSQKRSRDRPEDAGAMIAARVTLDGSVDPKATATGFR